MSVHLIKLCVGVETVDELARWQAGRLKELKKKKRPLVLMHVTRQTPKRAEELGKTDLRKAGFASVDYVAVRDAESLAPFASLGRPARILAAAKVGNTRLIDNMAV